MQTFLPYADFERSAKSLDKKRCWKQVVEAKQIISVLEGNTKAWANHPAVKMWDGYLPALKLYYNVFLQVSVHKHKINTKLLYIRLISPKNSIELPWFIGKSEFHRAMRARLVEKDETFYLPKFAKDKGFNNGKYFWPDNSNQTFKTI